MVPFGVEGDKLPSPKYGKESRAFLLVFKNLSRKKTAEAKQVIHCANKKCVTLSEAKQNKTKESKSHKHKQVRPSLGARWGAGRVTS